MRSLMIKENYLLYSQRLDRIYRKIYSSKIGLIDANENYWFKTFDDESRPTGTTYSHDRRR